MTAERNRINAILDSTLGMIFAIELVVVACPAMVGMLLGWRALGAMRENSGRRLGLDIALFAGLSWPLIGSVLLTGGMIWSIADAMAARFPVPLFVTSSLLLGGLVASRIALKTYRWIEGDRKAT